MRNEFIPYEQALELKELGFDEPLLGRFYTKPKCKMFGIDEKGRHYPIKNTPKKLYILGEHFVLNDDNVTIAPLYQQVFKWFRENHNLCTVIIPTITMYWTFKIIIVVESSIVEVPPYTNVDGNDYPTYEDAELECIKKLIEIAKLWNREI
jgi:hypothetical protein